MPETRRIPVKQIIRDETNPRKQFDEAELLALGQNMKAIGQLVPVLVYRTNLGFWLIDGDRRWRGAQLAGIAELDAVVLEKRPSQAEIAVWQMAIEQHRKGISPMEKSDHLVRLMKETGWSQTEAAEKLSMPQSAVSKFLAFQRLHPKLKRLLHDGEIDTEKGFILAGVDDVAKQLELIEQAEKLPREQLRRKVRNVGQAAETKAASARFVMPGGIRVAVQGNDLTLALVVEVLSETVRILKKSLTQGLDIKTQERVMRDTAKPKKETQP